MTSVRSKHTQKRTVLYSFFYKYLLLTDHGRQCVKGKFSLVPFLDNGSIRTFTLLGLERQ